MIATSPVGVGNGLHFRPRRGVWGLLADHWVFAALVLAGGLLRVVVTLGFRPILWFLGDSISYVGLAVGAAPFPMRPDTYSLFLWVLEPLHRLAVVAVVQHVGGVAVAVLVYAVCLRLGASKWVASAAAIPTLFDAWEVTIEQMLLSETMFIVSMMLSLAVLVWWPAPRRLPYWACCVCGFAMGMAATTKSLGEFLIAPVVIYLVARRAGLRRIAVVVVMFAVPLAAYAGWFDTQFGWFSESPGGLFAYGRVATFVDCAHDSLSPAQARLCPTSAEQAKGASWLIWSPSSPYNRLPGTLRYKTDLAMGFAITVIEHQPLAYLSAAWDDVTAEFSWNRHANVADTYQYNASDAYPPLPGEAQDVANLYQKVGNGQPHPIPAIANLFKRYQHWVHVPGLVFLAALIAASAKLSADTIRKRTNTTRAPAACFLLCAAILAITPDLVANLDYRYLVPVLPPLSVAVALAFTKNKTRRNLADPTQNRP